jgi:hypothetical protein
MWRRTFGQTKTPVGNVVPTSEFETDVVVDADKLEPCRLVKADAAGVRQNDLCEG